MQKINPILIINSKEFQEKKEQIFLSKKTTKNEFLSEPDYIPFEKEENLASYEEKMNPQNFVPKCIYCKGNHFACLCPNRKKLMNYCPLCKIFTHSEEECLFYSDAFEYSNRIVPNRSSTTANDLNKQKKKVDEIKICLNCGKEGHLMCFDQSIIKDGKYYFNESSEDENDEDLKTSVLEMIGHPFLSGSDNSTNGNEFIEFRDYPVSLSIIGQKNVPNMFADILTRPEFNCGYYDLLD